MFADIKRATDRGLNKHRTVVSKEEKKKVRRGKRGREKNTSDLTCTAVLWSVILINPFYFLFSVKFLKMSHSHVAV